MKKITNYFKNTLKVGFLILTALIVNTAAATFTVTNTNDSGTGSLRQAVLDANAAPTADTIVFDSAFFSVPRTITLATVIRISPNSITGDNLTITGPGANLLTISGNNATRHFETSSGSINDIVSISGMTLDSGTFNAGGSISNSAILTLTNIVFTNNRSTTGGAIFNSMSNATDGIVNVNSCQFINNSTTGTNINGDGGSAIHNINGTATITNSLMTGGTTLGGGGAIRNSGVMTITGSTITNNVSGGVGNSRGGGGIYNSGELTLNNSAVTGNTAGGDTGGGGIRNAFKLTLNSSNVSGNTATERGGGIYASGASSAEEFVSITNSTVSNNAANTGTGSTTFGNGGGIATEMQTNITGSTISGNSTRYIPGNFVLRMGNGGGIYAEHNLNLDNSTVSGNYAETNGGGIFDNYPGGVNSAVVITNSTIVGNRTVGLGIPGTSTGHGGGICYANSVGDVPTSIRNTIVANNTAGNTGPDLFNPIISHGYNLIRNVGGATITGTTTGNITGVDPRLGPLSNNGGLTRTHALLNGSPAIDAGDPTTFPATDQRGISRPQDGDGTGGARADIGAYERRLTDILANNRFDFDGDGKTDLSIFRPSSGEWWYLKSSNGGNFAAQFGASTDKIVPGDYTGDGKADIAFFRPSTGEWFVLRSEDFSFYSFPFGTATDIPVPADFDGDGKTDPAVFRPSTQTWFINQSSGGIVIRTFGANGDLPTPADYDGDGKADLAIFRPGVGEWWVERSSNSTGFALQFGTSSDKIVPGDYTGDGKADIAFWRPSTGQWFVLRSEDFSFFAVPFGASGDIPAPGDYDGDGKSDFAVFRPSNNTWYINASLSGVQIQGFGANGDIPVPNAFVR